MEKIALVTGASRGIGFGLSKALIKQGYTLILISKNAQSLHDAKLKLNSKHDIDTFACNLEKNEDIIECVQKIKTKYRHLDVLFNNAGVLPGKAIGQNNPLDHPDKQKYIETEEHFLQAFKINSLAPYYLTLALAPLLKKAPQPNVINMSSRMGQLSHMSKGHEAYRVSKTALNAITVLLAQELKEDNIRVNSVSPGWVKTDMGSQNAERSVEDCLPGLLWAASLDSHGPTGKFFADGEELSW